jgi:hypothetical protein
MSAEPGILKYQKSIDTLCSRSSLTIERTRSTDLTLTKPKERSYPMKKFSIREVETLKTTAALYSLGCGRTPILVLA